MKPTTRFLFFFLLPLLSMLAYPPSTLLNGIPVLVVVVAIFALLAFFLWRGNSNALTLAIFIQGLNVVVRMMMFFTHATPSLGQINWQYTIITTISIALSTYLVLRLDRNDIRAHMTT